MPERVLIVGGGVVGSAIALELARSGRSPLLLEAFELASGVSGGSLAAIARHLVGPADELPFVLEATDRWFGLHEELHEQTGIDFELDRCGQLRLVEAAGPDTEAELDRVSTLVEAERAAGLDVEMIDARRARNLVPPLDPQTVAAASWCPGDAKLNALLACRALAAGARKEGAEIRTGWRVLRLLPGPPWVAETTRGPVEADVVVVATGPWTPFLLDQLEPRLKHAIVPKRAQCCVSERLPPLINPVVASVSVGVSVGYTQLHQTRHGEILFNTVVASSDSRRQPGDLDVSVDQHFLVESARKLMRLFPVLGPVRLLRSWAASEAWTSDSRFLLGPLERYPGLILAAGDSGTGFLRAPLIGRIVAQLVAGETPEFNLQAYRPERMLVPEVEGP